MKLLLWLAGFAIILRAIRVLADRNAALDRQAQAKLERVKRQHDRGEYTPPSAEKRIRGLWIDAEHKQALAEDQKHRKPIRPIPFPKKGRAS